MTRRPGPPERGQRSPRRSKMTGGVCQDCRQRITYVTMTATGRKLPVDPIPVADGNVCARYSGTTLVGYVISQTRPALSGYTRFATHFSTCVDRPRPGHTRKPRPAAPEPLFDIEGNPST